MPKSLLTEAHIQEAIVAFLQLDGWRAIRTDPVSDRARGKGFGELGMPDYLFTRYGQMPNPPDDLRRAIGTMMWIEFKAPGKKPRAHQSAWHDAERARGALVLVVDDIDRFIEFYKSSGLARRCL